VLDTPSRHDTSLGSSQLAVFPSTQVRMLMPDQPHQDPAPRLPIPDTAPAPAADLSEPDPSIALQLISPIMWNTNDWRKSSACNAIDTNIFFPVGTTGYAIDQINLAKSICRDCPARLACLEFSLRTLQDDGIWGGHTEEERRVIRRARRVAARKAKLAAAANTQQTR
jgi:WhiB family transcriptional regulator, redox-sensing transcriptional regulator